MDDKALPHVLHAFKAEPARFTLHPPFDDGISRHEGAENRLIACGRGKDLATLCYFSLDKLPNGSAQLDLFEIVRLAIHKSPVSFNEACDGEIVGATVLSAKLDQISLILREGPDFSCAFDARACRERSCKRK